MFCAARLCLARSVTIDASQLRPGGRYRLCIDMDGSGNLIVFFLCFEISNWKQRFSILHFFISHLVYFRQTTVLTAGDSGLSVSCPFLVLNWTQMICFPNLSVGFLFSLSHSPTSSSASSSLLLTEIHTISPLLEGLVVELSGVVGCRRRRAVPLCFTADLALSRLSHIVFCVRFPQTFSHTGRPSLTHPLVHSFLHTHPLFLFFVFCLTHTHALLIGS